MFYLKIIPIIVLLFSMSFYGDVAFSQTSYHLFESGHVRPLAKSPNGGQLFAVNTPDNRLEIYDITAGGLLHKASVSVGLEPVAVAAKSDNEVWVVNHLSDSVSIIDLTLTPPIVTKTLLVGDEPRDIVFAGSGGSRAFITTAHRGQHLMDDSIRNLPGGGDPQLRNPGIGRADVWVFDANNLSYDTTVGGLPLQILNFFADTPRGLAVSPDGSTVYVGAFKSGNKTTTIPELAHCNNKPDFGIDLQCPIPVADSVVQDGASAAVVGPYANAPEHGSLLAPNPGMIVKHDGTAWRDSLNRDWSSSVHFNLPDLDVFSFDANTTSAVDLNLQSYAGVGTILFNLAVNPVNGKVYVTNTESPNEIRFEGAGIHGGSTVQGHLSESRVTIIDPAASSNPIQINHVNKHIDYSKLHTENVAQVDADIISMRSHTLATPLQMVFNTQGTKAYMAAFGSAKVGVFDVADLEDPNFASNFDPVAESANYISTEGGPSGLVLDEANNRLYVMQRFDHTLAEIDVATGVTVALHSIDDPEPAAIKQGRRFLYDASFSSGNGESSCASCHIFGDMDDLAWNLGDPDAVAEVVNLQPFFEGNAGLTGQKFHPMKGPMTTQTLRGMSTHGAMHWRGDRHNGVQLDLCIAPSSPSAEPTLVAACDENISFTNFIGAFNGLLGKKDPVQSSEMQAFSDFALKLAQPPNPVGSLDGVLTDSQALGMAVYFGFNDAAEMVAVPSVEPHRSTDGFTCNACHTLDPEKGFFGADGDQSDEATMFSQDMKIPHLRNAYQKVGAFGTSILPSGSEHPNFVQGQDQVRGFGFVHDGSFLSVEDFYRFFFFDEDPSDPSELNSLGTVGMSDEETIGMVDFTYAFPSDYASIVGQQVTLTAANSTSVNDRIALLSSAALDDFESFILGPNPKRCDLIVKGRVNNSDRGWFLQAADSYVDDLGVTGISEATLRATIATSGPLTFTCAPPGAGMRMGVDRDEDSLFDGLDNCPSVANLTQADFDSDNRGDSCDTDDDNDGLLDIDELLLATDPFDDDSDDDGIKDGIEVNTYNTNPLLADTDGDGATDLAEINLGSNPLAAPSNDWLPIILF